MPRRCCRRACRGRAQLAGAAANQSAQIAGTGQTYSEWGLTGVPETFWLNARGRIVAHFAGPVSSKQLADGAALAEQP